MIVYNCLKEDAAETENFARSDSGGAFLCDLLRCTYTRAEVTSEKEKKAQQDIAVWTELIATLLINKAGLPAVHSRLSTLAAPDNKPDGETLLYFFLEDALTEGSGTSVGDEEKEKEEEEDGMALESGACACLATEFGLLLSICMEHRAPPPSVSPSPSSSSSSAAAPSGLDAEAKTVRKLLQLLQVLAALTAQEERGGRKAALREHGLVRNCVELLRAVTATHVRQGAAPRALAGQHGLKRDLLRVIGNLSYRDRACQDMVRALGGIPLVLGATAIDENNPFAREWGVWCVRNLCEDNLENQAEIESLKPQKVDSVPQELADRGLKPEIDPATGKVKITRVGQPGSPAAAAQPEGPPTAPRPAKEEGGVESVARMTAELEEMGLRASVDPDTGLVDIAHPGAAPSKFSYPGPDK